MDWVRQCRRVLAAMGGLAGAMLAATPAVAADPASPPANKQETLPLAEDQPASGGGAVNLDGFFTLGTLHPLQSPSHGGAQRWQAGILGNAGSISDATGKGPLDDDMALRGGFAGYHVRDTDDPAIGYGVNLQFGSRVTGRTEQWRIQPGLDYNQALSPSLSLSSRLFSTYGLDTPSSSPASGGATALANDRGEGDSGFRDVGLSLGFDYAFSDRWALQTQATYSRQFSSQPSDSGSSDDPLPHQFFGGVVVNYKF
jgi:hypothetical protein